MNESGQSCFCHLQDERQGCKKPDSEGTCHVRDAGYDIAGDLDGVLEQFDRVVGLERLKAVHVNDSKNPLGSRKDRHERIGEGTIGLAPFARIVNHPVLCELPLILETPNELPGYAAEIELLRGMQRGE